MAERALDHAAGLQIKQMICAIVGHFLSENPDVQAAGYSCKESCCLQADNQHVPKILAPRLLAYLDATLPSSSNWSRAIPAIRLLRMLCWSLSKAQRHRYLSQLMKLLQDLHRDGSRLRLRNVLYRMNELCTIEAKLAATFPEAHELLMKMLQSESLDSESRYAIYDLYLHF